MRTRVLKALKIRNSSENVCFGTPFRSPLFLLGHTQVSIQGYRSEIFRGTSKRERTVHGNGLEFSPNQTTETAVIFLVEKVNSEKLNDMAECKTDNDRMSDFRTIRCTENLPKRSEHYIVRIKILFLRAKKMRLGPESVFVICLLK